MPPGTDGQNLDAGTDAARGDIGRKGLLHLRFLRTARRRWFSFAMADSSGKELTYGKALAASLALARKIRNRCGDARMVGIMLPASVGGVLANIATLMAGKVPVNLNFTAGPEAIAAAVGQCGIRTIVTSKVFLARAKLATPDGAWFIEDVMRTIGPLLRLGMLAAGLLLPVRVIEWLFVGGDREPRPIRVRMRHATCSGPDCANRRSPGCGSRSATTCTTSRGSRCSEPERSI